MRPISNYQPPDSIRSIPSTFASPRNVRYHVRMKSHVIFVAPISVLLLAVCAGPMWIAWDRAQKNTPEPKSTFLSNFNPKRVVEPLLANQSFGTFGEEGGGPHSHSIGFGWSFSMPVDEGMSLMNALNDDVAAQLALNGAQVISRSGDPLKGFRYEYRVGHNTGTVTIKPLSLAPTERRTALPVGMLDIRAQVDVFEKRDDRAPAS